MFPMPRMMVYGNSPSYPEIKKVIASEETYIILYADGDLYMRGMNSIGQFGTGAATIDNTNAKTWTLCDTGVDDVWAGFQITITRKGSDVFCAGSLRFMNSNSSVNTWTNITTTWATSALTIPMIDFTKIKQIAFSFYDTILLTTDGIAYGSGFNSQTELGAFGGGVLRRITTLDGINTFSYCGAGQIWCSLVSTDGNYYRSGAGDYGALGNGSTNKLNGFTLLNTPFVGGVSSLSTTYNSSMIYRNDGTFWGVGYRGLNQILDSQNSTGITTYKDVTANVTKVTTSAFRDFVRPSYTDWNHHKYLIFDDGLYMTNSLGLVKVHDYNILDDYKISHGREGDLIFVIDNKIYGCGVPKFLYDGNTSNTIFLDIRELPMPYK